MHVHDDLSTFRHTKISMVIDLNTYNQIIKLGIVQEQVSFFTLRQLRRVKVIINRQDSLIDTVEF